METSDSDSHKSANSSDLIDANQSTTAGSDQHTAHEQLQKQKLNSLSDNFFERVKDYFQSDLELTVQDYALLESMNKATTQVHTAFVNSLKN